MNDWKNDPKLRKIIAGLDSWLDVMLQRPHMYVSSPEAMEDIIHLVDLIKRLVADTDDGPSDLFGYSVFLRSKGFDAGTFCSQQREHSLTEQDRALFSKLGVFLKEYLQSDTSRIQMDGPES